MEDPKIIAYKAMYNFLEEYYLRTKSDDIGSLLGDISLLTDGTSADPAVKNDWNKAYDKAINNSNDDYLLKFID